MNVEEARKRAFLAGVVSTFGSGFAKQVEKQLENPERNNMVTSCKVCKALYAVFVVDVEADKVEEPKYEIATSPENARYKVLHKLGIEDPDSVSSFIQFIGQLKDAGK